MIDFKKEQLRAQLKGSFLEFTRTFFKLLTGRDFIISNPIGRESHHIQIARALTDVFKLKVPNHRLMINVPPGHGKSVFMSYWVAWCFTHYPDCNFLYISYSKSLAAKHTETIKKIMSLAHYKYLFDVQISQDSRAKDSFKTTKGGSVGAYGSAGSITGQDAGLPNLDRFSGAVIIDDAHKPDEVHSDTIRESVIDTFRETISQRKRGVNVPFVFGGQRLHESDLPSFLLEGGDGYEWSKVILQSIDIAGNALYPEAFPLESLLIQEKTDIYVFASQHQQNPQPSGGAIFKPEWFVHLDDEPTLLKTFITADTAETSKSYNDATVFSFWGLYKLNVGNRETDTLCLHWIDCKECRVEPHELEDEFLSFYADCMRHKMQPEFVAIEKKSTGTTLISVLKQIRGMHIRDINRTKASGSKTARYYEMQPYIASQKISFNFDAKHVDMCVEQARKITGNDSHRHDDIVDTLYDAVKIALIDKLVYHESVVDEDRANIVKTLAAHNFNKIKARKSQWQS